MSKKKMPEVFLLDTKLGFSTDMVDKFRKAGIESRKLQEILSNKESRVSFMKGVVQAKVEVVRMIESKLYSPAPPPEFRSSLASSVGEQNIVFFRLLAKHQGKPVAVCGFYNKSLDECLVYSPDGHKDAFDVEKGGDNLLFINSSEDVKRFISDVWNDAEPFDICFRYNIEEAGKTLEQLSFLEPAKDGRHNFNGAALCILDPSREKSVQKEKTPLAIG
jgi:hypothetical protein